MITSCRRDMNPSLQPSLSELIEHQHQIRQHQQTLNSHFNNQLSNRSSNNDTNNNLNNNLDSNPNNNLIDYNSPFYVGNQTNPIATSSGLHLGSMDIEYFDNTLAQFDFSLPSSTAHLTTTSNQLPSTVNFDTNDQTMMNSINTNNGCMTPSSSTYYSNTNSNANNHVLDLFNIDDFKMSGDSLPWSEVDYAV